MKLYRGLKENFNHKDLESQEKFNVLWKNILNIRAKGQFSYPEHLNKDISYLKKLDRYSRQYFTDRKEIAEAYAKKSRGSLVELDVSIDDILEHFIVEFQNYQSRKKDFEITYIVKGSLLYVYRDKWKVKITDF